MKVGLVMSGGAAKGAYQVGLLKAFAEHKIDIDIYAGASIGALNAVICASSDNVKDAYEKLNKIWGELGSKTPIELNAKEVSRLIVLSFLKLGYLNPKTRSFCLALEKIINKYIPSSGLISDEPIINLFNIFVDLDNKENWKDVWVSTFSGTELEAILEFVKEELGVEGKKANYHYLNIMEGNVLLETLLASAALPLLYKARSIEGKAHFDGGIRDNTPITPLLNKCDICFVSHLSNGSRFDRSVFKNSSTQVIEIRPSDEFVTEEGKFASIKAMLNFSSNKIIALAEMGYKDASRVIQRLKAQGTVEQAISSLDSEIDSLLDDIDNL